ncbi:hypothetical protein ppKF707_5459 [Metapseudomonas furukawaii]|uniref:Uncharacterized protein n=1 Tax=Metapseudomonas furukawaii TaxID=1149133 RepID=A0AAD1BV02_METFU|nr:hypothetical protein ppKF707_5459 [Pseudomonas furukawaii]BAU71693.1 hypothetical protein KF707C_50 [Pseudomonas furukawaii]
MGIAPMILRASGRLPPASVSVTLGNQTYRIKPELPDPLVNTRIR